MITPRTRAVRIAAIAVAATVALPVLLSGCTGQNAEGGQAGGTLTYWSMWKEGEPQQVVLADAIKKFEKESGIKVDVQWSGREVIQQVTPRLAAGNPPDLFDQAGSAIFGSLVANDGVIGLDDVYDSKPSGEEAKISEVIPENVANLYVNSKDEPVIAPYEVTGVTLWYNGLKQPSLNTPTWDEFRVKLDEIKAGGETPLAVDGDQSYYEMYWLTWAALRHGGPDVINAIATDKTGEAAEDPAVVAAADDILPLIEGGYFPSDFAGTKWPAQQTAWADGTSDTTFLAMGTWAPSETAAALEKSGVDVDSTIDYRSIPFPAAENGKGDDIAWIDDIGFAIPSKARNQEAAKEFIRFFMAKEQMEGIASTADNLTPRSDIDAPEALSDFAAEYEAGADAGALVTSPDGSFANSTWASQVYFPTVADLFNKKFGSGAEFGAALKERTIETLASQE